MGKTLTRFLRKEWTKSFLFNLRMTPEERRKIKAKADKYTQGNMSAWVKYASTELDPRPVDLS